MWSPTLEMTPPGSSVDVAGAAARPPAAAVEVVSGSSAFASPKLPKRMPLTEKIQVYLSKCVGVDMTFKTIVYILRMLTLYTGTADKAWQAKLQTLILNIIDCRMLSNHWKYIPTFRQCLSTFSHREKLPFYPWLLTALSFFFRTFEQFAGDISYMQKNVFNHWSRARISWHYKFNKSISLTCCLIVELLKIQQLRKKIVIRNRFESPTVSPTGSMSDQATFPCESVEELRSQLRRSVIFLVRNICDMIVYFQWIEWYRPYKTLEFTCGLISGSLGMYLVWGDIGAPPSPAKKEV